MRNLEEKRLLFLQLIKNNGNIENLINQGIDYIEIAQWIKEVLIDGYAIYDSERLVLTESGEIKIKELNSKLNREKMNIFISNQAEYALEGKKDVFDIYLPESF